MKYILLGTLNTEWIAKHAERTKESRGKLRALGITLNAVYYTQGPYDFVDVIDAPSGEAALQFSVWYASQGMGVSRRFRLSMTVRWNKQCAENQKTRSGKTAPRPNGILNPTARHCWMTPTCAKDSTCMPARSRTRPSRLRVRSDPGGCEPLVAASGALNAPGLPQVGFLGAVLESTQRWWSQTTYLNH
ncbi:MAG: GYD domain-containing protein [bacterium]